MAFGKTAAHAAFLAFISLSSWVSAQVVAARFDEIGATAQFPTGVAISFANDIAEIGDIDGDGIRDYAVADAAYIGVPILPNFINIGAVHVFSGVGQPASLLYSVFGQQRLDFFGWTVTAIDDIDGDGSNDFVVGVPGNGTGIGSIEAHSGASGALVWTIPSPFPAGSFFGHAVDVGPDYDLDGLRDLLVLDINNAAICSANGTVMATFPTPTSLSGTSTVPGAAKFIDDVTNDGFPDIAIGAPSLDQVSIVSGNFATIGIVVAVHTGATPGGRFGHSITTEVDSDGDGVDEIVVGEPLADRISMFSGRAGTGSAPLAVTTGGTGSRLGQALHNRTLTNSTRVLAGLPGTTGAGVDGMVQSNKSMLVEWTIQAPAGFTGAGFGSRVLGVSDRNLDGRNEFAVCSNVQVTSGLANGTAWVIFGANAALSALSGFGCGPLNLLVPDAAVVPNPTMKLFFFTNPANVGGFASLFIGTPAAPLPITPGCFFLLDLATAVSVSFPISTAGMQIPVPVPADPALLATTLGFQIVMVTPTATIEVTNSAIYNFGY